MVWGDGVALVADLEGAATVQMPHGTRLKTGRGQTLQLFCCLFHYGFGPDCRFFTTSPI